MGGVESFYMARGLEGKKMQRERRQGWQKSPERQQGSRRGTGCGLRFQHE